VRGPRPSSQSGRRSEGKALAEAREAAVAADARAAAAEARSAVAEEQAAAAEARALAAEAPLGRDRATHIKNFRVKLTMEIFTRVIQVLAMLPKTI